MAVVPAPVDKAALAGVDAANESTGRRTQRMGQLAKELVTMEVVKPYPSMPIREEDKRRDAELLKLAKAFATEMRRQGNSYALKSGTALRFTLGLPRPSSRCRRIAELSREALEFHIERRRKPAPAVKRRMEPDHDVMDSLLRHIRWSQPGRRRPHI